MGSLPTQSKFSKLIPTRKLTATLCLTLAFLFGSEGMSGSADLAKDAIALKGLVQRNGVYYKLLLSTPRIR
jgi:hypothetical protein